MYAMDTNKSVVIVGGCGHVGLPLGLVLATRGRKRVILLDIDPGKVRLINRGEMPFIEEGAHDLLEQTVGKSLCATLDVDCLRTAETVITVIGTPVDRYLNPTVNELYRSMDQTLEEMRDDSLFILRSTVSPGVTKLAHERISTLGRKIHLAFCPERIAEGRAIQELVTLPQIVAAFDAEARRRARDLFLSINPNVIELSPLEAELSKLFTHAWRYVNFALSNQFYMLAESYGVDFYRIYEAITRDYPRM